MTSTAFDDDDFSMMDMPAFTKVVPKKNAPWDDGSKRHKQTSSHVDKVIGSNTDGHEKVILMKTSVGCGPEIGKSRFYHEAVCLTPSMVKGQLLGHGPLILGAKEGDYGETNPAREESYRIARSLGPTSEVNLPCCFNFH